MDIDGHKQGVSNRRRPTIEKVGTDLMQASLTHSRSDKARHPLLKQNTHFHYEYVEFDRIEASLEDDNEEDEMYNIRVSVNSRVWVVHRSYDNFSSLDNQIHLCTFSRVSSSLIDLQQFSPDSVEDMNRTIAAYLEQFTRLCTGHPLYCGSVLNFFEIDSKGNRLTTSDDCSAINIPAIAAARTIKPYVSQAADELTLQVGDMVSVIDKPEPHESSWWRGKKKFEVGFFPSECVELIGGDNHKGQGPADTKPVLTGRGKLIAFLRMFFSNRPNRASLKQEGIVKERVFGCDLAEHLSNVSQSVPSVLTCCCEAIEEFGMLNGIYRLTGVASNIQQLRAELDGGLNVDLHSDKYVNDIHTITAVLKMYFRELPNPLLTYQLYDSFSEAVELSGVNRINKIKSCIARLPPPHYRTAKHLFGHIHKMANRSEDTGMDSKNLAIVWSPNLMRSKMVESGNVTGAQMLYSVSVQATLVEALISSYHSIFTDEDLMPAIDVNVKSRPNSIALSATGRLLTISEAQNRAANEEDKSKRDGASYIPDGADVIPVFHTIIDFNTNSDRKFDLRERSGPVPQTRHSDPASRSNQVTRESVPRWRSFFHKNKSSSVKSHRKKQDFSAMKKSGEGDDITENEIAHLSRRVQSSHSTSNIHARLLTDGDTLSIDDAAGEAGALQRAASHESFFDLAAPPSPLPQPAPAVQTLPSSSSLTHSSLARPLPTNPPPPKPARAQPATQVSPPQPPAPGCSPCKVTAQTASPPAASEEPVANWLPAKKNSLTPGVVFRPAYNKAVDELVAPPKATWKQSMNHVAEEYHPLSNVSTMHRSIQHIPQFLPALSRSPGDKDQLPSELPVMDVQREYEQGYEEENPYEEVIPRSSPGPTFTSQVLETNSSPQTVHSSRSSTPPAAEPPRCLSASKQSAGLIYAPVSYSPLALSVSPDRNTAVSDFQPFSTAHSAPTAKPAQTWPTVTVTSSPTKLSTSASAVAAANSPVFAANGSHTSEHFTFSKLEQQWQSPDMVQCMNQAVQARLSRSYSNSDSESRPSRAASRRTYGTDLDTPVYANVQAAQHVPQDTTSAVGGRPIPVPVKCRQSDVDSAIASSSAPLSTSQHGRRPSRKMEYVNRKYYDNDPKKVVRQMSADGASKAPAAEQHYMNVSDKMIKPADSALSSSWSSGHSFNTNSNYSQLSQRHRFDSLGSDSHSSTEDRLPNRSVRQRRITPPSPAPRKISLDSGRRHMDPSTAALNNPDLYSHSSASTTDPMTSCLGDPTLENGCPLDQT